VTLHFRLDGRDVAVPDDGGSLLDALRGPLGAHSVKDGCSPQGQCGCCTVLVDGQPRVSCVTPARRVAGRDVTTVDGLDPATRDAWADAFVACGASQCGFCTPGIIVRLAATSGPPARALGAHLCRCTGWRTILDAAARVGAPAASPTSPAPPVPPRDLGLAERRAGIEGRVPQAVGSHVALGRGGFADDGAPDDALVAVPDGRGGWAIGESLAEARAAAGKIQGRRTTVAARPPLDLPPGDWHRTLATSWVEPAYVETDASWCAPGGTPASPLGNGGAFGGKADSVAPNAARELADRHGRPVRVLLSREDTVRMGPKRPPIAAGLRPDGTGVLRVVRTPGIAERMRAVAPGLDIEEVDVPGPPTSVALRGAGWVEAAVLLDSLRDGGPADVRGPDGGRAGAEVRADGTIDVWVDAGAPLDEVVLRSYAVGAAHMAWSWVTSEQLTVDDEGVVHDLTVRSFGVVRAADTPPIDVTIEPSAAEPVNGSDAVFAAVAAATWRHLGFPSTWPAGPPSSRSR
jgi:aerobic-type carbon monoxide dehydrogenase small subunit (CoxS/CutS family)